MRAIRRHAEAAERHRATRDYERARAELLRALAIVERGPSWWHCPLTPLHWACREAALELRRHPHPREWASFALIDLGAR